MNKIQAQPTHRGVVLGDGSIGAGLRVEADVAVLATELN